MSNSHMTVLAVNCGSSSIKFKLFTVPDLHVRISGQASSVATKGASPSIKLTVHEDDGTDETETEEEEEDMPYEAVFERIIALIEASSSRHFEGDAKAVDVITAIAHRVVHGGTQTKPMDIYAGHTQELDLLEHLSQFAPLHNNRAIQVVKFCLDHLPNSHQVLCFDTLFHSTLPPEIYTYPLTTPKDPPPIPLRKYGAHGLSYAYILRTVSSHLQKPQEQLNLIVAHLGSGASVCLIKDGKSYDTSMGLTPLEGLPGGTRTGSVDPVLIFHHTPNAAEQVNFNGLPVSRGEMIMNKEGGIQAIAGTSNFGTITAQMDTNEDYALAYHVFLDRVLNFIGSYILKLYGAGSSLDGIVFSGGIGERSAQLRKDVGTYLAWMGCEVDDGINGGDTVGKQDVTEVSKEGCKLRMFVCLTDEEVQTASMAMEVMKGHGKI